MHSNGDDHDEEAAVIGGMIRRLECEQSGRNVPAPDYIKACFYRAADHSPC